MSNTAPKLQNAGHTQNCFQHHIKIAKTTKFLSESAFYTSKGHICKVLLSYGFWFKFCDKICSPYLIVEFLRIFPKSGTVNLKYLESHLVKDQNPLILNVDKFLRLIWVKTCQNGPVNF